MRTRRFDQTLPRPVLEVGVTSRVNIPLHPLIFDSVTYWMIGCALSYIRHAQSDSFLHSLPPRSGNLMVFFPEGWNSSQDSSSPDLQRGYCVWDPKWISLGQHIPLEDFESSWFSKDTRDRELLSLAWSLYSIPGLRPWVWWPLLNPVVILSDAGIDNTLFSELVRRDSPSAQVMRARIFQMKMRDFIVRGVWVVIRVEKLNTKWILKRACIRKILKGKIWREWIQEHIPLSPNFKQEEPPVDCAIVHSIFRDAMIVSFLLEDFWHTVEAEANFPRKLEFLLKFLLRPCG